MAVKYQKTLNYAIKQQIMQTLRRTDLYVIENDDNETGVCLVKIKNFRDETLIQYSHDKRKVVYNISYMGVVVAEISMPIKKEYEDTIDVCNAIEAKAKEFKRISNARAVMTKEESLVYQLAMREAQHARYD